MSIENGLLHLVRLQLHPFWTFAVRALTRCHTKSRLITKMVTFEKTPTPHMRTSSNKATPSNKRLTPDKAMTSNMTPISKNTLSNKRQPLPRCPGPKLEPFRGTASADIEFMEFIGNKEDMDSKVWQVRIDGTVYALKIVSATLIQLR